MKNIFKFFCLFFLLCFSLNLYAVKFLVNSDAHVGASDQAGTTQYNLKKAQLASMIDYINSKKNSTSSVADVFLVGDLTDQGSNSQLQSFKNEWLNPLVATGVNVCLCPGNHDEVSTIKYVPNFIKSRHKDTRYSFLLDDSLYVLVCGTCPDNSGSSCCKMDTLSWMKEELAGVNKDFPIVIFFHYNLVGPYSDFWSQGNKDAFYNVIKDYNILCIFTGHYHSTYTHLWNGKIPHACVGGNYFAVCEYSNGSLTISFRDKSGLTRSFADLLLQQ